MILAAGVFAAIWLYVYVRPAAIAVSAVDWPQRYQRQTRFLSAQPTLDEFVARETEGAASLRLAGPEWRAWRDRVAAFLAGGVSDAQLKARIGRSHPEDRLFFDASEPRMAPLAAALGPEKPHVYLEFDGSGPDRFLGATLLKPGDFSDAPAHIVHPYRRAAGLIALATLALYILLPWRRPGGQILAYNRVQGALLPDLVGLLLGGVFFALPLFVCTNDPIMSFVVREHGYFWLTVVALAASVFGLAAWAAAAWYASYEIALLPDRLRFRMLTRTEDYPLNDIEKVDAEIVQPPGWTGWARAAALISGNWRLLAAMTAGNRPYPALTLTARDGRKRRFALTGFRGSGRLLLWLRDAGVTVTDEALALAFGDDPITTEKPTTIPVRSAVPVQAAALAVLLAGVAVWALWRSAREHAFLAAPLPEREQVPPVETVLEQGRILNAMNAARDEMQKALEESQSTTGSQRDEALARWRRARQQFDDLHRQFKDVDRPPAREP
ncbi:MAG: hypothetical protein N2111_09820 [Candidatus Sumerlaeaceae bacterium]|nr:hypothetical protein [Candidatus Sumerlaeaceae bacterium]